MDEIYKPISRAEMMNTMVQKFGGVEVARYFLNDALSDIQTIEVGIGDNNPMLAAKSLGSLRDNLENLRTLLERKDQKPVIESEIKKNT